MQANAASHHHDHDHSAHGHDHSSHAEEGGLPEGLAGLVLVGGFLLMLLLDSLPWRRRFNSSIRSGGRSILLGRRFGGSGLLRLLRLLRLLLRQTSLLLLQQLEQVRRGTQQ